ncbi:MAG TPA: SDR family NAD(P)-dependent oxidoreductase [Fimbriimonas sp.]|nr:SDR family NAD(P)-dependent oxidoreductase [Fimbriimonas sp.]
MWLIYGCSTGLGKSLVDALIAKGDYVAVLTRTPDAVRKGVLAFDSTNLEPSDLAAAVMGTMQKFGRIDVLVNNAGYGAFGKVEDVTPSGLADQFRVNFFACATLMRLVIPIMRLQRSGRIINVSSIGALHPFPESGAYNASKAALSAMSQSADQELEGTGVRAINVMPGALRTAFKGENFRAFGSSEGVKGFVESVGTELGDPAKAANALIKLVEMDGAPRNVLLGSDAVAMASDALATALAEVASNEALSRSTDG